MYIYILMKYSLLHTPRCLWLNNRDRQIAFSGYITSTLEKSCSKDHHVPGSNRATCIPCMVCAFSNNSQVVYHFI